MGVAKVYFLALVFCRYNGGVPERPKGTDCKSVGGAFGGSNPPPSTTILYIVVTRLYRYLELSGNSSMVEHQPSKLRVAGSSLVSRSRTLPWGQVRNFWQVIVLRPRNSEVEYLLGKEEAIGSNPIVGSKYQAILESSGSD